MSYLVVLVSASSSVCTSRRPVLPRRFTESEHEVRISRAGLNKK
jgi:hypothetical protein